MTSFEELRLGYETKKPLINERQASLGPSTQELDSQELEEDSVVR